MRWKKVLSCTQLAPIHEEKEGNRSAGGTRYGVDPSSNHKEAKVGFHFAPDDKNGFGQARQMDNALQ